jgi:hypothetical protein
MADETDAGQLGLEIVANMVAITRERIGQHGLDNAKKSLPLIRTGKSIRNLVGQPIGQGDSALIVAAGPSIKRRDPAPLIVSSGYRGAIIVPDGGIRYCLTNGVIPDLIVTADPHATRIVRWFGDPELTQDRLDADDYWRRQDMDPAFADEVAINRQMLELVDRHGSRLKIALCSSASPAVVKRVHDAGLDVYWWNPMYDDPDMPESVTRRLFEENGLPCVYGGGNVGSACWMLASAVLDKKHIGLCGMDFSYYSGTPYYQTQYYHDIVELVGEDRLDAVYMRIFNPHENDWFYTDPAYMWYRQCFLEMASESDAKTYNCTEGGILFGGNVDYMPLRRFLGEVAAASVRSTRTS